MSTDEIWERDEPDSPCIRVCAIHPETGICVGCYRTLDEITRWSALDPAQRKALMQELPARAAQLKRRRGGRKR